MVEASPASSLVVAESDLLLEILVVAFDAPAQLGAIDQVGEGDVLGQSREPILGRLRFIVRPFDQQPLFRARLAEPLVTAGRAHAYPGIARGQPVRRALAPG